jgi:hypothetical protein
MALEVLVECCTHRLDPGLICPSTVCDATASMVSSRSRHERPPQNAASSSWLRRTAGPRRRNSIAQKHLVSVQDSMNPAHLNWPGLANIRQKRERRSLRRLRSEGEISRSSRKSRVPIAVAAQRSMVDSSPQAAEIVRVLNRGGPHALDRCDLRQPR